jgi:alkylhydroperoxidase/carboxymuconolactone decarboxylase family protein YurZ
MAQSGDTPVLDLLAAMTEQSFVASAPLDARTIMLVRLAALVAVGAPPASYALNVETAADVGVDAEQMRGLLAAIAPIVGAPRVVAAVGNIMRGLAIELAALDMGDEG